MAEISDQQDLGDAHPTDAHLTWAGLSTASPRNFADHEADGRAVNGKR